MNTTKLFYFGAGIAVCAGCLARLLTLNAEESFIVFCVGVAGLLLAFGTVVYDARTRVVELHDILNSLP
jgi:hypothetical protein